MSENRPEDFKILDDEDGEEGEDVFGIRRVNERRAEVDLEEWDIEEFIKLAESRKEDEEDDTEEDDPEIPDTTKLVVAPVPIPEVEAILQRGPKFKVKIGTLIQDIINIARDEFTNIDMKNLRAGLKIKKKKEYKAFAMEVALSNNPDRNTQKEKEKWNLLIQQFNNTDDIIQKLFRVRKLIELAKDINTPRNLSGFSNLDLTVDEDGYNIIDREIIHQVKDERTKKILREINKTKFK